MPKPMTYAATGVSIEAGDEAVERIKALTASTTIPGVIGGIGGFGGLFAPKLDGMAEPVLVSATDGVGTKLAVARATQRWSSVGIDLVAMCVDDLVCSGARPLFFLDYVATGKVTPALLEQLVTGVAEGCRQAGAALLGGETAEHPGEMDPDAVDMAGFAVGIVDRGAMLGPERVQPGDRLVGIASPGLRSNGYSLARAVLLEHAGLALDGPAWDGADVSLADELLRPSLIYCSAVLEAMAAAPGALHASCHVTGGGLAGNLVRSLPEGVVAKVKRGVLPVPRIFEEIARLGSVEPEEMDRVFNLGVGMILVVAPDAEATVLASLAASGLEAASLGEVVAGERGVELS